MSNQNSYISTDFGYFYFEDHVKTLKEDYGGDLEKWSSDIIQNLNDDGYLLDNTPEVQEATERLRLGYCLAMREYLDSNNKENEVA